MILIITNNSDPVTSRICTWLLHYKKDFRIISDEDHVDILRIESGSMLLENLTRGYTLELHEVRNILYRQGDIVLSKNKFKAPDLDLNDFLKRERWVLQEFLYSKIRQIPHLGHPQQADLNKLVILEKAAKYNLEVPAYIFTSSKIDLLNFKSQHTQIITKIIQPGYFYSKENVRYSCYTELLDQDEIDAFDTSFHPTFFQKFVSKKFDVRVFYLDGKFYSLAIMSQANAQTKVDFRIYDTELRNRNIAFQLPASIEADLRNLVLDLKLDYCSVDFVYGEDKKFYFLEINPIGQFGNVSYFGNYHLEKKIAELLCA